MKIIIISISIAVALAAILSAGVFVNGLKPVKLEKTPVILEIPKGAGLIEIVEKAYLSGLIRSKIIFEIYAALSGSAQRLQSGRYEIKSEVSVQELIRILTEGPPEISVVIFPGMTFKEIDDILAENKIIKSGELINYDLSELKSYYNFLNEAVSLEGFLLPDTYKFYQNSDSKFVVKKILSNFKDKAMPIINPVDFGYKFELGVDKKSDSLLELLIIASYLEKEIPGGKEGAKERRVAAGIMEKRLKSKMPLQIDATILYNKCFRRFLGECGRTFLKREDFKIDSAYNTYLRLGLTPTAISNPGLEAIRAVIEKEESPYWYYLSDPKTKRTIFSKNLDEHNRNRVKYLLNNKAK